jgi:hypothetical protein
MTMYDPKAGIEGQAADALNDAIALYKTAGWTARQGANAFEALWGMIGEAEPDNSEEEERRANYKYEQEFFNQG